MHEVNKTWNDVNGEVNKMAGNDEVNNGGVWT